MSRFNGSYEGIGEMLCAPFMVAEMQRRAERGRQFAEAIAPDAPPLGEGYKYEFRVESGVRGGDGKTRRAFGRIVNDSEHALPVEYGFAETPKYRVLGRALDAMGD